ncbi:MAG: hypothetical protein IKC26_00955 [Clostridia bacterium]|nr:hypothetical protein [Clostridia bacterium]
MIDGKGDNYHTTVTVFEPDVFRDGFPFDYVEYLLENDSNFELNVDITTESSNPDAAYGETLATASEKELSKGSISYPDGSVKGKTKKFSSNETAYLDAVFHRDIEDTQKTADVDGSYSVRKSNRSTLTAALDSVVTDPEERRILDVYRANIENLDAQQERLQELNAEIKNLSFSDGAKDRARISELRQEAIKTQNRINLYDKKLLGLEAMAPMKRVVERQAQKAYEKAAERGRETLTKRRESAERTELRGKIKRVVQDLNQYLLRGTKDRHVPIGLQNAVASALNAVNMDTVEADKRIERLEAELMMAKTPAEMQKISRKIDHIREMGDRLDQRLGALRAAYNGIMESEDPMVKNAYDDVVAGLIQKAIDEVGETPLRSMTREQLELVYDSYKAVLKRVRDANKAFKLEGDQKISSLGDQVMEEILKVGGAKEYRAEIAETISRLGWNNLKPIYAFERIGSTVFTSLFNNVRAGEDTWARDVSEAREFYLKVNKKYHYASWDFEKRYRFKSKTGKSFSLTLEQMMSLYAYSKREQADKHLEVGGFVFSGDVVRYKEAVDEGGGNGKKQKKTLFKYKVNTSSAYSISKETLGSIAASLTEEQRGFVDEMQEYLSTVMGEKGNEVSLALYDVKLYKERFYFPLKSAKQFMFEQNETAGEVKVKNSGLSKETKPQAGNPIILSGFMDVWANHVNDMSMYHAFVLPLEDFNRVFNWNANVYADDKNSVSVKSRLQDAYGEESVQYISQLLKDLNGGARTDPRETTAKALMSKFKKASVMASLSVVVQQPTAVVRAMALVDPKYFVGRSSQKGHPARWEQLKKYAPVAIIKEMGYFDTNMGRSTVDWIKDEKTFMDRVDDAMSKAPALADELTWVAIWEAVKRETASEHTDLSKNSEELLKLAGERFTEVITKTQVYDSVLSRSSNMRSKSTFMNMLTSFMGEPTTSINMLEDALRQGKRGNKGYAARAIFSLFGSVMLNSALVSLVYAARDDDEDETFWEKYVSRVTTEMLDGLNPLTYLPIFRDIWSILQGFDVERADMSLVSDLADAFKKVVKTAAKDTENMDEDEFKAHMMKLGDDLLGVLSSLCSLTGIPLKNVVRESKALINIFEMIGRNDKTTFGSLVDQVQEDVQSSVPVANWFQKESKGDKLYDAIVKGDDVYVDRLKDGYASENAYDSAVRKALRENDERVEDAASAMLEGDLDTYERTLNEIIEEGSFTSEDVAYAINAEYNAKAKKLDPEASERTLASVTVGEGDEEKTVYSIYAASDINVFLERGDSERAKEIIEKLVAFKVENGKTEKDARSSIRSSMTSYWKKLYKEAWSSKDMGRVKEIRALLYATGLYGRLSELDDTLRSWRKD